MTAPNQSQSNLLTAACQCLQTLIERIQMPLRRTESARSQGPVPSIPVHVVNISVYLSSHMSASISVRACMRPYVSVCQIQGFWPLPSLNMIRGLHLGGWGGGGVGWGGEGAGVGKPSLHQRTAQHRVHVHRHPQRGGPLPLSQSEGVGRTNLGHMSIYLLVLASLYLCGNGLNRSIGLRSTTSSKKPRS